MQVNCINMNTNFALNFSAKKQNHNKYPKVPTGADYEIIDTLDLNSAKTAYQLRSQMRKNEDISADKEKLIFSRLKTAMNDIKQFLFEQPKTEDNPVFSYDDMVQEMACGIVEGTEGELNKTSRVYNSGYKYDRDNCFTKIKTENDLRSAAEAKFHAADHTPDVEEEFFKSVLKNDVGKELGKLNPKAQEIIALRFGLADGIERTQEEVGKICKLPKVRVAQIEAMALRKLSTSSTLRSYAPNSYIKKL